MWKKIALSFILILIILSGLYAAKYFQEKHMQTMAPANEAASEFDDRVYEYKAGELSDSCLMNSKMACAVDFAVKCTLEPTYTGCAESKLPRFIFMEDENLKRPTEMSFKLSKIKPISADLVELHTDSECNGNWFGLCRGRVIYVLVPDGENWRVKDIYAMENF